MSLGYVLIARDAIYTLWRIIVCLIPFKFILDYVLLSLFRVCFPIALGHLLLPGSGLAQFQWGLCKSRTTLVKVKNHDCSFHKMTRYQAEVNNSFHLWYHGAPVVEMRKFPLFWVFRPLSRVEPTNYSISARGAKMR
jgi:hypothetical protein